MLELISEAVKYIRKITKVEPETGIILGTGLNSLAEKIEQKIIIEYKNIPGFCIPTVSTHSGRLIFGSLGGNNVMIMQGRFHYYEGYNMKELTFPVRVMKFLGVENLIVTNASGGINKDFNIGDLMIIKDHINFFPENPLHGENIKKLGPRFPDMSESYSPELIKLAQKVSRDLNINLSEGVYLGLQGPNLETPAEYNMFRIWGADTVGMSTIPEVIVARHMGMNCFGVSVISNLGIPGKIINVSLDDIVKEAAKADEKLTMLIQEIVRCLK